MVLYGIVCPVTTKTQYFLIIKSQFKLANFTAKYMNKSSLLSNLVPSNLVLAETLVFSDGYVGTNVIRKPSKVILISYKVE